MYKEYLRKKIVTELFDKQIEMNQASMVNIFVANNELCDGYYDIIVYKNIRYRKHKRVKSWAAGIELRVELQDEMQTIIDERDSLCADRREFEQWFRAFCLLCNNYTAVVQNIPDCLKEYCDREYTFTYGVETMLPVFKKDVFINTEMIIELVSKRKLTNLLLG
jgi:hypothetical protein